MAAGKENTALQIALIIFVLLTIVLSVTTYIYYDKFRTARDEKVAAVKKTEKADASRSEAEAKTTRLKELVGKGVADPVQGIMDEFERHQQIYGATLPEDSTKIYPVMLEAQSDAIRKLQDQIVVYQEQIAREKANFEQQVATIQQELAQVQVSFKNQASVIREVREEFVTARKTHEEQLASTSQQVREKQGEILAIRDEAKVRETELAEQLREKADLVQQFKDEVKPYREYKSEPPDGKIIRINQTKGTAYIDLGSADGLRRQTTFSVFPFDVTNALDRTPKGTIEVIRIVDPHMAEARITYDSPTDPIVRGDKIVSPIFQKGRPERFAVAGFIDLTGNGRSDLPQLLTLIRQNGGVVDSYVDEEGNRQGLMSPGTKFMISGERPDDKSDPEILKGYRKMLDDAQKHGVGTMALDDFLDYIGHQGRERSVGLGGRADPRDFRPKPEGGAPPFRRRSSGTSRPGTRSAYD
jgi:hypothetical protein